MSDPGSSTHISESLITIFGIKNHNKALRGGLNDIFLSWNFEYFWRLWTPNTDPDPWIYVYILNYLNVLRRLTCLAASLSIRVAQPERPLLPGELGRRHLRCVHEVGKQVCWVGKLFPNYFLSWRHMYNSIRSKVKGFVWKEFSRFNFFPFICSYF